jgi:hypothetical protein
MSDSTLSRGREAPMRDLPPLDRAMEKLKTLDLSFSQGLLMLAIALLRLSATGPDRFFAICALFGAVFVVVGIRGGGPFRDPFPGAGGAVVPSERRHLGPVPRVLAGLLGACFLFVAAWSALDGDWFSAAISFPVGAGICLIAATGGGRVWVERATMDGTISSAS